MDVLFALQDAQNQKLKTSVWYREVNDSVFFRACWTPELDLLQDVIIRRNRYYLVFVVLYVCSRPDLLESE